MQSQLSMQVFGVYLIVVAGAGLMLFPHGVLGLFGLAAAGDGWIRMVGMLVSIIGGYYVLAARSRLTDLYRWSVPLRLYAAGFMVVMFLSGMLGAGILAFAAVDACGALWTWAALRMEGARGG